MEQTLQALGAILLRAVPTILLVTFLHLFLKNLFFRPLADVLQRRYELTEGARKDAQASLERAGQRVASYEQALREARNEMYREQEQHRMQLRQAHDAAVAQARAAAEERVSEAKSVLATEAAQAKESLRGESERLAEQIAGRLLAGRAA